MRATLHNSENLIKLLVNLPDLDYLEYTEIYDFSQPVIEEWMQTPDTFAEHVESIWATHTDLPMDSRYDVRAFLALQMPSNRISYLLACRMQELLCEIAVRFPDRKNAEDPEALFLDTDGLTLFFFNEADAKADSEYAGFMSVEDLMAYQRVGFDLRHTKPIQGMPN